MAFINGTPLAGFGATSALPEFERTQNQSDAPARATGGISDNIARIGLPISMPPQNGDPGCGNAGASGSSGSLSSIFSAIMQSLSNVMSQIASYFGNGSGSAYAGSGYGSTPSPQSFFTNASAGSVGDPHETFNGTSASGANVNGRWDSMSGHADLLDSDSFRGGYRVSTTTTAPAANGVTYNQGATVATHDGTDAVTLNRDGSYAISDRGQNITLAQGQAASLGRNETVTLNADKSLTIVDTNDSGGTLTTTLSNNGHGVDVNVSGNNVDLGGYLVTKSDATPGPVGFQPRAGVSYGIDGTYANDPSITPFANGYASAYAQQPNASIGQTTTDSYGNDTEPLGPGEIEFA